MPKRTRSARATMPITSTLPPWALTITSLRRPARCTASPISVKARMAVSPDRVIVPGEAPCSSDLPTACVGRTRIESASGSRAVTSAIMPSAMSVSVATGRGDERAGGEGGGGEVAPVKLAHATMPP